MGKSPIGLCNLSAELRYGRVTRGFYCINLPLCDSC
nr:Ycf15 [Myricaria prostrata]YP_009745765.1 Ycf15 [Myricaria prostrata]WDW30726.1 hypothetical protein RF15 [Myricaria wardii]QIH30274.1 Ycf15 [Myricaria prostrata]QIH30290.1 Ycf15 [Myricaria prostrata]WDW30742.1 hypothetical protein RF15 [Myricaria wardii]